MLFRIKVIKDVKKNKTKEISVVYKIRTRIKGSLYLVTIMSLGIISQGISSILFMMTFDAKRERAGIKTIKMHPIPRQAG